MDKLYDKRTRKTRRRSEKGNTYRSTQNYNRKYRIGKRQAMMEYMVSASRNSLPFTKD